MAQGSQYSIENSKFQVVDMEQTIRAQPFSSMNSYSTNTTSAFENQSHSVEIPDGKRNSEDIAKAGVCLSEIFDQDRNTECDSKLSPNKLDRYRFHDYLRVQDDDKEKTDEKQLQIFWKCARSLCQGIVEAPFTYKGENKGVVSNIFSTILMNLMQATKNSS